MNKQTVSVIIAAAGSSTRMEGENKQLADLCGVPVVVRSMQIFDNIEECAEIVVSVRECDKETIENLAREHNIKKFTACVVGGDTRQQSVINAVRALTRPSDLIAVHDGARPLANPEKIMQCIHDAAVFGGAVMGVPVKDTIKEVDDGMVTDTPDRRRLYITQTPQIFGRKKFIEAINFAIAHNLDFTDDCQLAEAIGVKVNMTISDYRNIKITTPEDLIIARALYMN